MFELGIQKNWIDALYARSSVRQYTGAPDKEQLDRLGETCRKLSWQGVKIRMFKGPGLKSQIKGTDVYAVIVAKRGTPMEVEGYMGEALVLLDKIDTPRYINNYVFDVVDRVEPPDDADGKFAVFLELITRILSVLQLREELFTQPSSDMPFFNTSDLPLSPSELQNIIVYLYCVRCINHMVIRNDTLARRLSPALLQQLIRIALRPLPCNVSFNTLIIRQYYNWFIEYLIDTYPGAARLLPMELQTEEVGVHPKKAMSACFGVGKEEAEKDEEYGKPVLILNEARMREAAAISERENWSVEEAYTVLLVRVA